MANSLSRTQSLERVKPLIPPRTSLSNLLSYLSFFSIPGVIGDFKCTTSTASNCQIYSVGKSENGDFTYDYSANKAILQAAGITNIAATPTKKRMLRDLQSTTGGGAANASPAITNPVMCIN
jgi:hypothetical protein